MSSGDPKRADPGFFQRGSGDINPKQGGTFQGMQLTKSCHFGAMGATPWWPDRASAKRALWPPRMASQLFVLAKVVTLSLIHRVNLERSDSTREYKGAKLHVYIYILYLYFVLIYKYVNDAMYIYIYIMVYYMMLYLQKSASSFGTVGSSP